ncbi:hypothetical protein JBE04_24765 [Streptomyces sp. PRKS01-29]|nr:hypothetical protein [Streptomyces sabulosicollis]MBI0297586.1 hypothetical protein [Streptomyces sabulosicollis]
MSKRDTVAAAKSLIKRDGASVDPEDRQGAIAERYVRNHYTPRRFYGVRFDDMETSPDHCLEAEKAAIEFYRALEGIGVVLHGIRVEEPCDKCGPSDGQGVTVALGNLYVDDVEKYTSIIEGLTIGTKQAAEV